MIPLDPASISAHRTKPSGKNIRKIAPRNSSPEEQWGFNFDRDFSAGAGINRKAAGILFFHRLAPRREKDKGCAKDRRKRTGHVLHESHTIGPLSDHFLLTGLGSDMSQLTVFGKDLWSVG
ncbi:Hypothetical protein NTJ_08781 [Nesidiocoris tenuis]|uniref:Uncharacterized protein n=1 Tax=Nesidiocoris tenuis TaxID=355587 RepID=A0ABN7AX80_9HEMI|nr:Hypothetical protein NTJ_08781 [Nesidiocoris tenuis]